MRRDGNDGSEDFDASAFLSSGILVSPDDDVDRVFGADDDVDRFW